VKRAALLLGLISLLWLAGACSGGGSSTNDPEAGPLNIELLWAEPATGASPLRVVFTANITGGVAPYYYSWDFTNDGSVDTYINGEFKRTVSVANNYYFRASDPDVTVYNAVLTVTDSVGTAVTSDPVQVNVLGTQAIDVNPEQTGAWSDETEWDEVAERLIYVYEHGVPVYFRAAPISGTPPYSYHWDFDADGTIDSTLAAPQNIYTNTTGFPQLVRYTLEIIDANDERILWEGYLDLQPEIPDINQDQRPFDIVIMSTPEINPNDGMIHIQYDPLGGGVNVDEEPKLDISVIVNTNGGGGAPPFEYYWDFEDDGSLDSQALSPTIPYYDFERNILINPYLSQEEVKMFNLRCMVIDSAGRIQTEVIPIEVTQYRGLDPILVVPTYGVSENSTFLEPRVPFAEAQSSRATVTEVMFDFDISGSTGVYEFQFDLDGDGNPDDVAGINFDDDTENDDVMVGGWYKMYGNDKLNFAVPYQGVDYFPTEVSIRGVDTAGNAASVVTYQMPVSIVTRTPIPLDDGELDPRRDHQITANWTIEMSTANGQRIAEREITIAGGRRGTSVLNSVQRLIQTYDPATENGKIEELNFTGASDRSPMNQERHSSVMWTLNPDTGPGAQIRIHGGENVINGLLQSNESSTGGAGAIPWTVLGEILVPDYFPLKSMAGTYAAGENMYVMAGGLHQPADEDNPVASRRLISYDPVFDAYGHMSNMSAGRYDCGIAYANGMIYVIGGREAGGTSVATMETYNPTTGAWNTFSPQMQEARSGAICQVIDGKVYMIGGAYWPSDEADPIILDTAEVFNPATGVWSYTLPLPNDIYNQNAHKMASVAVPSPGGVNATGGFLNSIVCFGGEGFDDASDTSMGELNRLYEFTYFHVVDLPVT